MFIYSILANHLFINLILPFSPYHHSIHPMSSIKQPIFKGQKTVFFHCFLTQFSSSNHYMLWSTSTSSPYHHNTSSESRTQHALTTGIDQLAVPLVAYNFHPPEASHLLPKLMDCTIHRQLY